MKFQYLITNLYHSVVNVVFLSVHHLILIDNICTHTDTWLPKVPYTLAVIAGHVKGP